MPVVISGGAGSFDAVAFGVPSQANLNFLEQRLDFMSERLGQAGQEFMARGLEVFNKYGGSEAIRLAKAAVRTVQHAFDRNVVKPLEDIGALQQAGSVMQRWIMACPKIRNLYHAQRLDGYSNSYVDMHPSDVGRNHYDWQLVMTGQLQDTPDDPEYDWEATNYFTGNPDDVLLTLREKHDIMTTWDLISRLAVPGKEDPTSPFADKM